MPAIGLILLWLLDDIALLFMAFALPALYLGAGRMLPRATPPPQSDSTLPSQLNAALKHHAHYGCISLQLDEVSQLIAQYGRSALNAIQSQSLQRLHDDAPPQSLITALESGGFLVALPLPKQGTQTALEQLADRLQERLSAPFTYEASRLYSTVSLGLCLNQDAPDGKALLEGAQAAAEEAQRQGQGQQCLYSPELAQAQSARHSLRRALSDALLNGEIRPHFQPQINTDTGDISGVEALARWHHPERGQLSPAAFLDAIREAGLCDRFASTMLSQSLATLREWEQRGHYVDRVAVNFAATELRNPHLAESVKWELDRHQLSPDRLAVEVLETVVAESTGDIIIDNLNALHEMGCLIDMDDFGTGHASITSIRRFAVGRIKIDRSFIAGIDRDSEQQKIVSAILTMAERLKIDTLAEGVETAAELTILSQLGCTHAQGYQIARPMPRQEAEEWIAHHRAQLLRQSPLALPSRSS